MAPTTYHVDQGRRVDRRIDWMTLVVGAKSDAMPTRLALLDDLHADPERRRTRAAELVADALIALMVKERLAARCRRSPPSAPT